MALRKIIEDPTDQLLAELDSPDLDPSLKCELRLELESVSKGIHQYNKMVSSQKAGETPYGKKILRRILLPITEKIQEDMREGRLKHLEAVFGAIGIKYIAFITCRAILDYICKDRNKHCGIIWVKYAVGRAVRDQRLMQIGVEGNYYEMSRIINYYRKRDVRLLNSFLKREQIVDDVFPWEKEDLWLIGSYLTDILITTTGILQIFEEYDSADRKHQYVRMSDEFSELITSIHKDNEALAPTFQPMVVPPINWSDNFNGGYIFLQKPLIRENNFRQSLGKFTHKEYPDVFRALNITQNVPWKINNKIVDIAYEIIKNERRVPGYDLTITADIPSFKTEYKLDKRLMAAYKDEARNAYRQNYQAGKQKLNLLRNITLAKNYENHSQIYHPYHLDWRGRMYAMSHLCSPQGHDLSRACLLFANGKRLEKEGTYSLAVHVANLFNMDKLSENERLDWVRDNWGELQESAENPIDGRRFWCTADKPFLALAAILELVEASENCDYVSHVPIPLDGSCNGLQWICALSKDAEGGAYVNLYDSERPEDIYSHVAFKLIKNLFAIPFDDNAAFWIKELGLERPYSYEEIKRDKIIRNIVKRPTMTYSYGVSHYGIKRQLEDERLLEGMRGSHKRHSCLKWFAKMLHSVIENVIQSGSEFMDYLRECAELVSHHNKSLFWHSPSGFKVNYGYKKYSSRSIKTIIGDINVYKEVAPIDRTKFRNSLPANFIHSIDAGHLVSIINECYKQGITDMSPVHDSFAFHACYIPKAKNIIRQTFYEIANKDYLNLFVEELKQQFPNIDFPVFKYGNLDCKKILDSSYLFN